MLKKIVSGLLFISGMTLMGFSIYHIFSMWYVVSHEDVSKFGSVSKHKCVGTKIVVNKYGEISYFAYYIEDDVMHEVIIQKEQLYHMCHENDIITVVKYLDKEFLIFEPELDIA